MKPFEIFGNSKVVFSEFKYTLPNGLHKNIPFGFIFSIKHFENILLDINSFIENQIYSYWDYYRQFNTKT